MKKIILVCLMMLGAVAAIQAQDTTDTRDPEQTEDAARTANDQDEYTDKDLITVAELPPNIRMQLQSTDYAGWTISQAYRKSKEDKTFYKIELTNGEQKKKLKFDANGNLIKDKEKDNEDY